MMHDLGVMPPKPMAEPPYATAMPAKPHYPSLELSSSELPPVATWKVGSTYTLTIEVKMTGHRLAYQGKATRGDFDVLRAKVEPLGFAKG